MELIILYGAPGVGKLTVAESLAAKTGYNLFHNHLTTDMVGSLFPFGSADWTRLVSRFRIEMLEEAAQAGLDGVIHTFVYAAGIDDDFMQQLIDAVENHGGKATLVLLTCDQDVNLERLVSESRVRFGKLRDPEIARRLMANERLAESFPRRPSLVIDNTHRSAEDVATEIADTIALRNQATSGSASGRDGQDRGAIEADVG